MDTDSRHLRTTFAFLRQNVRYFRRKFFTFYEKISESIDFKVHGAVAAKACLPARGEDPQPAGTRCWAAGWGRMAWKGKVANILQEVDLPLISDSTCAKTNNERYFKPVRNLKIQLQTF